MKTPLPTSTPLPASAMTLMPAEADIPEDFKRRYDRNYWVRIQRRWFFNGLDQSILVAKEGIDKKAAIRHLGAIQYSFEPRHEHKEAGVAYLLSLWFVEPAPAEDGA